MARATTKVAENLLNMVLSNDRTELILASICAKRVIYDCDRYLFLFLFFLRQNCSVWTSTLLIGDKGTVKVEKVDSDNKKMRTKERGREIDSRENGR